MLLRKDIPEFFLHYIWKNKLFDKDLKDVNNNAVTVLSTGIQNTDAGPDFFNAKIKIADTVWAGNIEIHKKASDWYKHKHHEDKAYNNVILHIVAENDRETRTQDNKIIPNLVLPFDSELYAHYLSLIKTEQSIVCKDYIKQIDRFYLNNWLSNLLVERAEQKTDFAKILLEFKTKNWEELCYIMTARAFGFKVNALPFELLAKSLPSIILAKHKNNLFQIEALLFGQAGMLSDNKIQDDYYLQLQKEYQFLKNKYSLQTGDAHLWKFLRIRPSNFPTVRIAQFADLIFKSSHLFSKVLEAQKVSELEKLFNISASDYWQTHYKFGKKSSSKTKQLGKAGIYSIIINTVIPILLLYGKEKNNPEITEQALMFLENIKAEKNNITKKWENIGIDIKNAYFSQSFIQLYNEYCIKKRCLDCRIGHQIIQKQ